MAYTLSGEHYGALQLVAEAEREAAESEQEHHDALRSIEVARVRHVAEAIKAIPAHRFTAAAASHLVAVLRNRISDSTFAQLDGVPYGIQCLDELSDLLGDV